MSFYARLIAVLLLLGALSAVMWGMQRRGQQQGRAEVQAKWDKDSRDRAEAEKSALLVWVKNNERIAEQQALDGQRITKDTNNELSQIGAAYDGSRHTDAGLRVTAGICRGLAPAANTASAAASDAATAATVALPAEIERNLQNLMQEADTIVAGCRATQQFIRVNGMYAGGQE
ncbi:hypothetical protein [Undibacterium sp.]|uniref:hypothetical protein n=1 Tax=Undibacterium sp. TaxID=1914977 RepID=UPI00374D6BF6